MTASDLEKNRDEAHAHIERLEDELAKWRAAKQHIDKALLSVQGVTIMRIRRTSAEREHAVRTLVTYLAANRGKPFTTSELLLVVPDWPIRKLVEVHNGSASNIKTPIEVIGESKGRQYLIR